MSKIRVHELAKELGKSSKDIIYALKGHGIIVESHMSAISNESAEKIRRFFNGQGKTASKDEIKNSGNRENMKNLQVKQEARPERTAVKTEYRDRGVTGPNREDNRQGGQNRERRDENRQCRDDNRQGGRNFRDRGDNRPNRDDNRQGGQNRERRDDNRQGRDDNRQGGRQQGGDRNTQRGNYRDSRGRDRDNKFNLDSAISKEVVVTKDSTRENRRNFKDKGARERDQRERNTEKTGPKGARNMQPSKKALTPPTPKPKPVVEKVTSI